MNRLIISLLIFSSSFSMLICSQDEQKIMRLSDAQWEECKSVLGLHCRRHVVDERTRQFIDKVYKNIVTKDDWGGFYRGGFSMSTCHRFRTWDEQGIWQVLHCNCPSNEILLKIAEFAARIRIS